jgi:hypothetical protein
LDDLLLNVKTLNADKEHKKVSQLYATGYNKWESHLGGRKIEKT